MNAYLLALLSFILIFMEFYLPGAILGIIGGLLLFVSYFVLISEGANILEVVLFIGVTLTLLTLLIRYLLWSIPREKKGIYSSGSQQGYVSSSYDKDAIGKEGIVLTDLRPGGFIVLEGGQHPAISITGYIDKGQRVKVIGGEGESLLVKGIELSKDEL